MVDTINPNAQTPEPPSEGGDLNQTSNTASTPTSSGAGFYNGFDRPDSTRINLAGDNPGKVERIGNDEYDRLANQKLVGSVPPEKDFDNGENLSNLDPKLQEIKIEPKPESKFNELPPKDILEKEDDANGVTNPASVGSQAPHFAPVEPKEPMTPSVKINEKEPLNVKAILMILFGGIAVAAIVGFLSYYFSGLYYDKKIDEQEKKLSEIEEQINTLNQGPAPLTPSTTSTTVPSSTTTTIPSATTTTKQIVVPSTTTTTTTTTTKAITPATTIPGGLG